MEDRGTEREVRQSQTTLSQVAHFSFSSRPRQGPSPELSRAWLDSSALVQVGRCPASPSPPEAPPCRRRRGHQVAPSSTGQGPARVLAWAARWTLAPCPLPLSICRTTREIVSKGECGACGSAHREPRAVQRGPTA